MTRREAYYQLTKPGMVYGNLLPAITGFAMAATTNFDIVRLLSMLIGLCLVMMSSCVVNNITDRRLDAQMKRTKHRALPLHIVPPKGAVLWAFLLGITGLIILLWNSPPLVAVFASVGWVMYALVYTWLKPRTHLATAVGTIPGAVPPLVGWFAGGGGFDMTAYMLCAILVLWQFVHFYTIALRCREDYHRAYVPTFTEVYGPAMTATAIRLYGSLYVLLVGIITWQYFDRTVLTVMIVASQLPLFIAVWKHHHGIDVWAKRVFFASLIALTLWACLTALAALLLS
ncbi:MAG: heme o synthase [Candidatus Saccharimonadales bacterium]